MIGILHKDLDAARRTLLEALISYNKTRGHEITVVFDGWRGGTREGTRTAHGGINIIFSRLGEKADAVIKRILQMKGSEGLILVTSDRELVSAAWAANAVPVPSDEILKKLSPLREKTGPGASREAPGDFEEETKIPARRSRTLSRKQKAVERALGKL